MVSYVFSYGFLALALTFFFFFYSQPLEFPCEIKPRSRHNVELIRSTSGLLEPE